MPFGLTEIWNITSKYIYTNKKVGIYTSVPVSELDVYGHISENGTNLENKYILKTDGNKKNNLLITDIYNNVDRIHESLSLDIRSLLIIWLKFDKVDFLKNNGLDTITLECSKSVDLISSEYIIGTNSAKISDEIYYTINLNNEELNNVKYTICFWVFLNRIDINQYILKCDDKDEILRFRIEINNNNELCWVNTTDEYKTLNFKFTKSEWYHVSLILDQSNNFELNININGVNIFSEIADSKFFIQNNDISTKIYLGFMNNNLNGYIDDFRIYAEKISTSNINESIIGNGLKLKPSGISGIGNYGIDILNYENKVNIGNIDNPVDLEIYGDIIVSNIVSDLNIEGDVIIKNNLNVNKEIKENDISLINKYLLISDRDKNTDIIVTTLIDNYDTSNLYMKLDSYYRHGLLIRFNFDYNKKNLIDTGYFMKNTAYSDYDGNKGIDGNIISRELYDIEKLNLKSDSSINYGTKYIKGNSSLELKSNTYYFESTYNNVDTGFIHDNFGALTLMCWVRYNEINIPQQIFQIGEPDHFIELYLDSNNALIFSVNSDNTSDDMKISSIDIQKDKWYHIVITWFKPSLLILASDLKSSDENNTISIFKKSESFIETSDSVYLKYINNSETNFILKVSVNGILVGTTKQYEYIFKATESSRDVYMNYLGVDHKGLRHMNGYIDDFRLYNKIIPISEINKYILGKALILDTGNLSAIGNYGIDILNHTNKVNIGSDINSVNLSIYGDLNIKDLKISSNSEYIEICNLSINHKLLVESNIIKDCKIIKKIYGDGFSLEETNSYFKNLTVENNSTIENLNVNYGTISNLTITDGMNLQGVTFDDLNVKKLNHLNVFALENSTVRIYSNLHIGDSTNYEYNYNSYTYGTGANYQMATLSRISNSTNIYIYDKSFIFNGINSNIPDITFTNTLGSIKKSIGFNIDNRDLTRIKLDIGNIDITNGFIKIQKYDIRHIYHIENPCADYILLEEDKITLYKSNDGNTSNKKFIIDTTGFNYYDNNNTTNINKEIVLCNILTNTNAIMSSSELNINVINVNTIDVNSINVNTIDVNTIDVNTIDVNTIDVTNVNVSIISVKNNVKIQNNDDYVLLEDDKISLYQSTDGITSNKIKMDMNGYYYNDDNNRTTINTEVVLCNILTNTNAKMSSSELNINEIHVNDIGASNVNVSNISVNNNVKIQKNHDYVLLEDDRFSLYQSIDGITSNKTIMINNNGYYYDDNVTTMTLNNELCLCNILTNTNTIMSSSKLNINEINVNTIDVSNIINVSNISVSNIISDTIITKNSISVSNIKVSNIDFLTNTLTIEEIRVNNIIIGEGVGNNSISSTGTIEVNNILTTNEDVGIISIDTRNNDICGKIVGDLCLNSKIDITSGINCVNLNCDSIGCVNSITCDNLISSIDINCETFTCTNEFTVASINLDNNGDLITTDEVLHHTINIRNKNNNKITTHIHDNFIKLYKLNNEETECFKINGYGVYYQTDIGSGSEKNYHIIGLTEDKIKLKCDLIESDSMDVKTLNIIKAGTPIKCNIQISSDGIRSYSEDNICLSIEGTSILLDNIKILETVVDFQMENRVTITCHSLKTANLIIPEGGLNYEDIISYELKRYITNPSITTANVVIGSVNLINRKTAHERDLLWVPSEPLGSISDGWIRCDNMAIDNELYIGNFHTEDDGETVHSSLRIKHKTVGQNGSKILLSGHNTTGNTDPIQLLEIDLLNGNIGISAKAKSLAKLFVEGTIQASEDIIGFSDLSDKRLKNNIKGLNNSIDIVNKLNPIMFKWNENLFNSNMSGKEDVGFIAQEIEEIIPYAIRECKLYDDDILYKCIKYERIIPYLVDNIKELNKKILELEKRLDKI